MPTIDNSAVQPIHFLTVELSFRTREGYAATPTSRPVPTCSIGTEGQFLHNSQGQDAFQAKLTIELLNDDTAAPLPYEARLVVVGLFATIAEVNLEYHVKWQQLVLNGLNLTYGYARDALADATSRAPHGSFLLPAVYLGAVGEELLTQAPPNPGDLQEPLVDVESASAGPKQRRPRTNQRL